MTLVCNWYHHVLLSCVTHDTQKPLNSDLTGLPTLDSMCSRQPMVLHVSRRAKEEARVCLAFGSLKPVEAEAYHWDPLAAVLTLSAHTCVQDGQSEEAARVCLACAQRGAQGRLGLKLSKSGGFVGCSSYPDCTYSRAMELQQSSDSPDEMQQDTMALKLAEGELCF